MSMRVLAGLACLWLMLFVVFPAQSQTVNGSVRIDNCDGQFNNQTQSCSLDLTSLISSLPNFGGFSSATIQFTISGNSPTVGAGSTNSGPVLQNITCSAFSGCGDQGVTYLNYTDTINNYFTVPSSSVVATVGSVTTTAAAPAFPNPSVLTSSTQSTFSGITGTYIDPTTGQIYACNGLQIDCIQVVTTNTYSMTSGLTGIYSASVSLDGTTLGALNSATPTLPFSLAYTNSNYTQFAILTYAYTPLAPGQALSNAGMLSVPRSGHSATSLMNGQVLVAGGQGGSGTLTSAEVYNPSTSSWSAVGNMADARYNHTATLLPSGLVLVAGGISAAGGTLSSAELYNPASGVWTPGGTMQTGRFSHTATLLPNGQVLVTGGDIGGGTTASSAEIYNPATNTWQAVASMSTARESHTATLLANGMVLVAAGVQTGTSVALSSAEIFNPATSTWAPAGSLSIARYNHTATLLANGQVLVAGGAGGAGSATAAELYNPSTATWSSTGSLTVPRSMHTASLLPNGRVLITGGVNPGATGGLPSATEVYDPTSASWSYGPTLGSSGVAQTATLLPEGKVLIAGGVTSSGVLARCALYSPTMSTSATGVEPLAAVHASGTATSLPNGWALVAGGRDASGVATATAELYNPATASWSAAGAMASARYSHTATLLPNGLVLITGGWGTSNQPITGAELYNPVTNTWTAAGSLVTPRAGHTATLLANGLVLAAGGYASTTSLHQSAELYNPATNSWTLTSSLVNPRAAFTATLLPGKVLVAGGVGAGAGNYQSSAEIYDVAAKTWSSTGSMATGRNGHFAALLPNGQVLVAGGQGVNGTPAILASAELYSPSAKIWTSAPPMTVARMQMSSTFLPNGQILVAGGTGTNGALSSAELYDPLTNAWSSGINLPYAPYWHSAALLTNGQVLLASGWGTTSASVVGTTVAVATPVLQHPPAAIAVGSELSLSGTSFTGVGESTSGSTQSSPSNHPVARLQRIDNGQQVWLGSDPTTSYSGTGLTTGPVTGLDPGPATLTVFSNGASSGAVPILVGLDTPAGAGMSVSPVDPVTGSQSTTVSFPSVTGAGQTTVTTHVTAPPTPATFSTCTPSVLLDIATTAQFSGTATVCVNPAALGASCNASPTLWHYTAGAWQQLPPPSNPPPGLVCGLTSSFSPFAVLGAAFTAQTINFPTIGNQTLGSGNLTISATASSGLPVTLTSQSPSICSVSGTNITLIAPGICSIVATQSGNATYAAAPRVVQMFSITAPTAPTVTESASTVSVGQTSTLSVTASGSGPFTYQWYQGVSGNVSSPVSRATGASFTTPPLTQTTTYWVAVTGPGGIQDSGTVTVTVTNGAAADAPLPLWALMVLSAGLLLIASRRSLIDKR